MNRYEAMISTLEQSLPHVSREDIERLRKAQPPCLLVDVREPDEFAGGHIPGA